ncbi:Carotene biosynthesis-related protein CBR, chloroplastic [Tetrabaena socialis]|uniref:Carotene biosynthesis-related protein CBR, chloroplastic n=2 Tax=Tetrabaena socialis TaxID=47790 RepID=A0A2J7ZNH2_9CHLO|nr:Carotene biosynthesis-related protein CBR, chloroplastic [Tetrabaena socialis]PNH01817.1 Carotene biosynthesis-related protein CBR, chloroplastic [Tetrabaena socialis]|eukprot:PNH01816.1 Carotene biosynthesis-related protein CBR, chloroplastic [Tetrabaena socialis]
MSFAGPAPELINGRLAMLGVVSALGAEFATGESVLTQFADAPLPILAVAAALIFASLTPMLKGANLTEAFGPLTPSVEITNGRAAMLGLAALLAIEAIKGASLF